METNNAPFVSNIMSSVALLLPIKKKVDWFNFVNLDFDESLNMNCLCSNNK